MVNAAEQMCESVEAIYRSASRRILATLIRLLGDFDLAEDALHDAFAAAVEQWPKEGLPASPRAWLISTGRFKAIDAWRRRARFDASQAVIAEQLGANTTDAVAGQDEDVEDNPLRLIFTCCHPAPAPEARLALTLRWKNGKVCITDGPYAETKEQLGGILILQARDLNHAIQLMSKHPGVKNGPFEIRPAEDLAERIRQSERRRSSEE